MMTGSPQQKEQAMNIMSQINTPQVKEFPTGFTYVGNDYIGWTRTGRPTLPQETATTHTPFGGSTPSFLPGSRTPQMTVPTIGGEGADKASAAVNDFMKSVGEAGEASREQLKKFWHYLMNPS